MLVILDVDICQGACIQPGTVVLPRDFCGYYRDLIRYPWAPHILYYISNGVGLLTHTAWRLAVLKMLGEAFCRIYGVCGVSLL